MTSSSTARVSIPTALSNGRRCVTVLQNGVVVQNHFHLLGATYYDRPPKYAAHPAKLPLTLQFHHNATRFRNIWIREIHEPPKVKEDSKA